MAAVQDEVNIDINIRNVSKALSDFSKLESVGYKIGTMQAKGIDMSDAFTGMSKGLRNNIQGFTALKMGIKAGTEDVKRMRQQFDMNYLSIMFGGMYLQKFGQSLTSLVLPAMGRFADFQHKGVKSINAMNASLEFLKFSIFDAFSQTDVFKWFIEAVINISDTISNFIGKHPVWTAVIATFGAALTAIGGILTGLATGYTILKAAMGFMNLIFGTQLGETAALTAALTANTAALSANAAAATADATALGGISAAALTSNQAVAGFWSTLTVGSAAAGIGTITIAIADLAAAILTTGYAFKKAAEIKAMYAKYLFGDVSNNAVANFVDPTLRGGTSWTPDYVDTQLTTVQTQSQMTDAVIKNSLAKTFANLGTNISDNTTNFDKFASNISSYKPAPITVDVVYREVNKPSSVSTLNVTSGMSSDPAKYTSSTNPGSGSSLSNSVANAAQMSTSRTTPVSAWGY